MAPTNYKDLSIGIVGTGNVAVNLGIELKRKGYHIQSVYSRSNYSGLLSEIPGCTTKNLYKDILNDDLIFFCIPDSALADILNQVKINETSIIAHTSASTPLSVFSEKKSNSGVFYLLQTFNKDIPETDFSAIPIFIQSENQKSKEILFGIASDLSENVIESNDKQRLFLHIAAVFACNFTNYMYTVSEKLCLQNNIDFKWLAPLIIKTANRAVANSPKQVQTGPAIRNDLPTILKHSDSLHQIPEVKELYTFITNSIFAEYKNDKDA